MVWYPYASIPPKPTATASVVNQQFRVSCIMFGDKGSTAVINGSPVRVGQTVRAEGVPKAGLGEEATIKKIDRNCVEIEYSGERFTLRI